MGQKQDLFMLVILYLKSQLSKKAYLSRIGLSQWVQTISMVSWVIGGAAPAHSGPHSLTQNAHICPPTTDPSLKILPLLTPTRASAPPTQQEHGGPAGFYGGGACGNKSESPERTAPRD